MEFKRFLTEHTWYHGSRRDVSDIGGTKQRFGGIHLGTKQAAMDRLEHTPSERVGGKPGPAFIYAFQVNLTNPYNTPKTPMREHDVFMLINTPGELQKMQEHYDGLYYINNIEDKGSISLLVFDKSKLKLIATMKVTV